MWIGFDDCCFTALPKSTYYIYLHTSVPFIQYLTETVNKTHNKHTEAPVSVAPTLPRSLIAKYKALELHGNKHRHHKNHKFLIGSPRPNFTGNIRVVLLFTLHVAICIDATPGTVLLDCRILIHRILTSIRISRVTYSIECSFSGGWSKDE